MMSIKLCKGLAKTVKLLIKGTQIKSTIESEKRLIFDTAMKPMRQNTRMFAILVKIPKVEKIVCSTFKTLVT